MAAMKRLAMRLLRTQGSFSLFTRVSARAIADFQGVLGGAQCREPMPSR